MKRKILISAIGGDIGYGIINALRESDHDLHIIGFDVKKYNVSLDLVDDFFVSPKYKDETKWLDFVLKIICEYDIDYFWPVTESEILLVDKNRSMFEQTTVVINKHNVLSISLDKWNTAMFLKNGGLNTPATWKPTEMYEDKYPLIVKEAFGCGSHSVCLVNNKSELEQAISEMKSPIIQEYKGNESDEYTLTIFSDKRIINFIAFKRLLGFGGMSRYVELVNDDYISDIAYKIAELFELEGSINVQMRKDNGKYYIFEINPRISSTIGFRLKLGFNDVAWWLDLLNEKNVEQYKYPNKKVYGVRTVEEKLYYD